MSRRLLEPDRSVEVGVWFGNRQIREDVRLTSSGFHLITDGLVRTVAKSCTASV